MALSLKSYFTVFNAIGLTTTTRIPPQGTEWPEHANSIILEVVGADTPSWTLDIQGRASPSGTFVAVDYVQIWQAGAAALSNAQLSITDTTRRFYMIPNCPVSLQLIATRTTGTLTVYGSYTSEVFTQHLLTTARGSIYVEGPAASDAASLGGPVKVGGEVDDTTPASAGEGDIRTYRSTPEGNQIVELYNNNITLKVVDFDDADKAHTSVDDTLAVAALLFGSGLSGATATAIGVDTVGSDGRTLGQDNFPMFTKERLLAPDAAYDMKRSAQDIAPGLGAQNVAPIGGDIVLRASAVAGEASGTSTAVDNLGWVKSFLATLNVSATPSGGAPTLDVYIQTETAEASIFQDLLHYPQVTSGVRHQCSWGPNQGNVNGTQAESAAVTVDNHFATETAGLAAATIRLLPLGNSMRVQWVFAAGGSTGDYTFVVNIAVHS